MNKFFLLMCSTVLSNFLSFDIQGSDSNENAFSASFWDKKKCECPTECECDAVFCECMPFFVGQVDSSTRFPLNALDNSDFRGFVKVPIVSTDGFGGGYTVKNKPLCDNCRVIAPANRVDICHCGWFKVSFFGSVINTIEDDIIGPVELMLRSPILGNMHVASIPESEVDINGKPIPIQLAATDYKFVSKAPNCCTPMYFSVELSNLFPSHVDEYVQFTPGSGISIERIGPCDCCPKNKPCCQNPCKDCEKNKDRKND